MPRFYSGNSRSARLTAAQVQTIRARYQAGGVTQGDLAREYQVSVVQIGRIVRGESWQHMPLPQAGPDEQALALQRLVNLRSELEPEKRVESAVEKMQRELSGAVGNELLEELKEKK